MSEPTSPENTNNVSKPPQMGRRQFLKNAALLGTAGALAGSIPTRFYGIFDTKRTESGLEQDIESRMGVEILSLNEAVDVFGKTSAEKVDKDLIFNKDQLEMLNELLPLLPKRFTAPYNDKKLNIADVKIGFIPGMKRGAYSRPTGFPSFDDRPVMLLVGEYFQPERKGMLLRLLAHELTHRVDGELTEGNILQKEVLDVLGYANFTDFRDSVLPILDEVPPDSNEATGIRDWLGYGLKGMENRGMATPVEFLGVLGGIYIGGRQDFDQMSVWFGKETTDRLYDFVKDRIFDGREYNGQDRPAFLDARSYSD